MGSAGTAAVAEAATAAESAARVPVDRFEGRTVAEWRDVTGAHAERATAAYEDVRDILDELRKLFGVWVPLCDTDGMVPTGERGEWRAAAVPAWADEVFPGVRAIVRAADRYSRKAHDMWCHTRWEAVEASDNGEIYPARRAADLARRAGAFADGCERAVSEARTAVESARGAVPGDPGVPDTWGSEDGAIPDVDTSRGPQVGPVAAELGPVPGPGGTGMVTAAGAPAVAGAPVSGVRLPEAAVLTAETAMAHGWTVAMERHPSGVVVVRAAERMPRPYRSGSGELVAVWVDGVYDADRSAVFIDAATVVVAPVLERVRATVGRAAKAGDITTAGYLPGAGAPAPVGVSDTGTEDGREGDGGACAVVDAPRAPGGGSGAALTPSADAGGLPVVGLDAVVAAGVPVVDVDMSSARTVDAAEPAAPRPESSGLSGARQVDRGAPETRTRRGRCFTDHHDVDGVPLYEARNTVARCAGWVAADLGVDPCALPAVPGPADAAPKSNLSGARQIGEGSARPWAPAPDGERWDIALVRETLTARGLPEFGESDGWHVGPDMWNVMITRVQGSDISRPRGTRAREKWDAALPAYVDAVEGAGLELVRRNKHCVVVRVGVPDALMFTARARRTGGLDEFTTAVEFEGWPGIGGTVELRSAGPGASAYVVRDHTGRTGTRPRAEEPPRGHRIARAVVRPAQPRPVHRGRPGTARSPRRPRDGRGTAGGRRRDHPGDGRQPAGRPRPRLPLRGGARRSGHRGRLDLVLNIPAGAGRHQAGPVGRGAAPPNCRCRCGPPA